MTLRGLAAAGIRPSELRSLPDRRTRAGPVAAGAPKPAVEAGRQTRLGPDGSAPTTGASTQAAADDRAAIGAGVRRADRRQRSTRIGAAGRADLGCRPDQTPWRSWVKRQASPTIVARSVRVGLPAQRRGRRLAGGDQHGRVAAAAGRDHGRDRVPGHARGRPRPPPAPRSRCPMPRLYTACLPGSGVRQREQVGLGEVVDVDVVADAGAVRRRPVVAVDLHRLPVAGGHLQHDRDEVGLHDVPLAEPAVRARPR